MNRILIVLILLIALGCKRTKDHLLEPLKTSLDLFYLENNNQEVLDATSKIIANNNSSEVKTVALLLRVGAYCELSQLDSADAILRGVDTALLKANSDLQFWYKSIHGLLLFRQNKLLKAYSELHGVAGNDCYDKRAIGLNQRLLARICFSLSENKKGIEWLLLSNLNFKKAGLPKSIAINKKLLGRYFMNDGNYLEAFKNYKLAENELLATYDTLELKYIYINISDYYIKTNNFEKAKYYANLVLNTKTDTIDLQAEALAYNKLGEIAHWQENYRLSNIYYQKTLALGSDYTSSASRRTYSYLGFCQNYTSLNQPKVALKYAKSAQELAAKSAQIQVQYDANLSLAACYNKLGLNNMAYMYQDLAIQLRDSIFKQAALSTRAFYDTQNDLMKVSSEMELLNEKSKKQRNVFVFFALLLTFATIFAFIIYRLQHSKNQFLKVLVKKNLQIIDDERRLNEALQLKLSSKKLARKSTDEDKDMILFNEFTDWILQGKQYRRKDLTVDIIAHEMGTNRDYLSRAINQQQLHFKELINKYRIDEAVKILNYKCDSRNKYNLRIIGSEVGFKSNSVFIDAFRKQTGMNPAQFRAIACLGKSQEGLEGMKAEKFD